MLTLPTLGQRMHRQVQEAEAAANDAIAKLAALTESCALARGLPEVGATTGQATMLRLAQAAQQLTKGAAGIARVHGDLRKLNDERNVMIADFNGDCPPATGVISDAAAA